MLWKIYESEFMFFFSFLLTHFVYLLSGTCFLSVTGGFSDKETSCQCRRLRFNPLSGKAESTLQTKVHLVKATVFSSSHVQM